MIGVDYGTRSGRAVAVRVSDGTVLGSAVHPYPHDVITRHLPDGTSLPPETALQSPADWREVLTVTVPAALAEAGVDPADVDRDRHGLHRQHGAARSWPTGTPLCELPGLAGRLHAWPKLWKHHAAQSQADRINALAAARGETWLPRYGGKISSEWQFAKALQVLEEDAGDLRPRPTAGSRRPTGSSGS